MPRLNAVTDGKASDKVRGLLAGIERKLGTVPNVMRTMANSPAVLEGYLALSAALGKGSLSAKVREQIALAVGEANGCGYCVAAHAALGRTAGLSEEEIADSRRGASADARTDTALGFARTVVTQRGRVGDDDLARLRGAGFTDGDIAEIVANVALNLFTNYLNHVAETEIDFPEAQQHESSPACAC